MNGPNFLMADGHVKWLNSTGYAAVSSSAVQGGGNTNRQPSTAAQGPNQPQAEGTQYGGAGAHAVTFSRNKLDHSPASKCPRAPRIPVAAVSIRLIPSSLERRVFTSHSRRGFKIGAIGYNIYTSIDSADL